MMRDAKITWAFLTPTIARTLLPEQVPTLEALVCGGESLTADVISAWAPSVQLIHIYRPAEFAVYASSYRCTMADDVKRESVSLGRLFGCACFVTEPDNPDRLVPNHSFH